MTDEYLFISDCHLEVNRQDITDSLIRFLQNRATEARYLYVLGDLFETWIGDDDPAADYRDVFQCFKDLSRSAEIFFLVGNRDFLFAEVGCDRIGASIIREPHSLTLGNCETVLLHGDSLCTDDLAYQAFRKMVRGQAWQDDFLSKSLQERKHVVAALREQSKAAMQSKSVAIMDVNQHTVHESFAEFGADIMIHGHTHRPAIHNYEGNLTRYVLGDWNPKASFLSWREDKGFKLTDYRVPA